MLLLSVGKHILLPYLEKLLIYRAQFSKKKTPLTKVCQREADPNVKDLSFIPIWLAASQISELKKQDAMTNVKVNDRTDNLSPAAINYTSRSQISRKKGKIGC